MVPLDSKSPTDDLFSPAVTEQRLYNLDSTESRRIIDNQGDYRDGFSEKTKTNSIFRLLTTSKDCKNAIFFSTRFRNKPFPQSGDRTWQEALKKTRIHR